MISKEDRAQIAIFIGNQPMMDAVKRVLLPEEPLATDLDPSRDDAEYGRAVKAWVGARKLITDRFAELGRIASSNPQPPQQNEAR